MDNISIRSHIIENFKNDSIEELKNAINESVQDKDEELLPGLGVFFTLAFLEADDKEKENIISLVKKGLEKNS